MDRRLWAVSALVALVALVALTACGGGATQDGAGAAGSVAVAGGDQQADGQAVLGAELVGRWAHYDVVAYEEPFMRTLIISYGFNDFSVDDGSLIDTAQFCFAEQVTDQPIETFLSDAATQAIKPIPTPVTVELDSGVLRLRRPPTPTPVGVRLDDPANEALPTDPADPRLVDDDGDGNPGITVLVRFDGGSEEQLFIARREIFEYDVTLRGPDELDGVVTDRSEQLIIGATNEALLATDAQWTQYPDLSKSPILLRRVTPDWDCDRLRAERDRLFPPNPTIDW